MSETSEKFQRVSHKFRSDALNALIAELHRHADEGGLRNTSLEEMMQKTSFDVLASGLNSAFKKRAGMTLGEYKKKLIEQLDDDARVKSPIEEFYAFISTVGLTDRQLGMDNRKALPDKYGYTSWSTLDAGFKTRYGVYIAQYLNQRRFQEASDMICNTDLPLARIIIQVGLGEVGHLENLFSKTGNVDLHQLIKEKRPQGGVAEPTAAQ